MRPEEGVPGGNPIQKPLFVWQRQIPGGIGKKHRVVVLQVVQAQLGEALFHGRLPLRLRGLVFGLLRLEPVQNFRRRILLRLFGGARLVGRLLGEIQCEKPALLAEFGQDFLKCPKRND